MYYLASNGNFYSQIAISDSDNYSIRELDDFFILTISKEITGFHLDYANDILAKLRSLGLEFVAYDLNETQFKLVEEYRHNRDMKHSYFPIQFIRGPIPVNLMCEWNHKEVIKGIKTNDGWIPSKDCEWR